MVAAAGRDPEVAAAIADAKATRRWGDLLEADGWHRDEEGDLPTARAVVKLSEPIEQRRADRRDFDALVRLLGSTDAVARTGNALSRGETMADAWASVWAPRARQHLSEALGVDVTGWSWSNVRGLL